MAGDPQNKQYGEGASLFGRDAAAYASTGAPGSGGITPEMDAGPVVGTPVVSVPGASSQVAENMPTVKVTSGDTCAMASDSPVPTTGDPMTGLGLDFIASTGAGQGNTHTTHPGARP